MSKFKDCQLTPLEQGWLHYVLPQNISKLMQTNSFWIVAEPKFLLGKVKMLRKHMRKVTKIQHIVYRYKKLHLFIQYSFLMKECQLTLLKQRWL